MDDKRDPNFYRKDKTFDLLPNRVQAAVRKSEERSKHSDFYYKLKNLNFKIHLYNRLFYNKVPQYQMKFMLKKIAFLEQKQKKDREVFEKEIQIINIEKRKQVRRHTNAALAQLSSGLKLQMRANQLKGRPGPPRSTFHASKRGSRRSLKN